MIVQKIKVIEDILNTLNVKRLGENLTEVGIRIGTFGRGVTL